MTVLPMLHGIEVDHEFGSPKCTVLKPSKFQVFVAWACTLVVRDGGYVYTCT